MSDMNPFSRDGYDAASLLQRIAEAVGWSSSGPELWPADLPERVQALVAARDWWKKAAEHTLGKLSEARAERDEAIARMEAWPKSPLPDPDAENPAHLRWAADLIEAETIAHLWPSSDDADEAYGVSAALRVEAKDREAEVVARSRRDTLIDKGHAAWEEALGWAHLKDRDGIAAVVDVVLAEVGQ